MADKKTKAEYPNDIQMALDRIGERVREKRKAINNNYVKFAEERKVNRVTLQQIESGANFRMSSLIQVLKALDMTIDDFFKDGVL